VARFAIAQIAGLARLTGHLAQLDGGEFLINVVRQISFAQAKDLPA